MMLYHGLSIILIILMLINYLNSNPASGRVMQKLGLKKEGVLIDHVRKENRFEDLVYYGIINSVGL